MKKEWINSISQAALNTLIFVETSLCAIAIKVIKDISGNSFSFDKIINILQFAGIACFIFFIINFSFLSVRRIIKNRKYQDRK